MAVAVTRATGAISPARVVGAVSPVRAAGAMSPARMPNLPVIEHPMAKLGDKNDLAVRGSSSLGVRRENTVGVVQHGKVDQGHRGLQDHESLLIRKSSPDRILNWPPDTARSATAISLKSSKSRSSTSLEVDIKPPYSYKKKPFKGLPPLKSAERDKVPGLIPETVDKYPVVAQIQRLPPLPSIEEQEEFLKGPGKPAIRSKEYNYQPRNTKELTEVIRDKLGTGYYGIRHLFKSNDPSGKGQVSREALQRILYTLCGYITPDQYSKLLKEMKLEGKTPIPFDSFVGYFKETEDTQKGWVSAIQTAPMYQCDPAYPEPYLRRTDLRVHDPYTSMPFSDAIFKEKCRSRDFDAHKVFPGSVFEPDGLILPPQLREAYATLGIYMTDDDFDKLWKRYDKEGTGALHTNQFFRSCGLDPKGRPRQAAPYTPRGAAYPLPRPHSEIAHTNGLDKPPNIKNLLKGGTKINHDVLKTDETKADLSENRVKAPINVPIATTEGKDAGLNVDSNANATDQEKKVGAKEDRTKLEKIKKPKAPPKLDNIIDCLHYKFEESYSAMLTAFQLFDFLNDNYISKVDFRRVLQEFGFNISVTDMDHFFKKCGIKSSKGQINYKEFLNKYQNKSENSITAKIASNINHVFHGEQPSPGSNLTPEELESKLIEQFHGDFIKILTHFRDCDKYSLGVITPHEFKAGIEKRLGYTMTDAQWAQLKCDVGQDQDGLIPYTKFLELFDITPGAWNQRSEGLIQVPQVSQADIPIPPEVERLKVRSHTTMVPSPEPAKQPDSTRTLTEIHAKLDELFKNKFHTFDKHFKAMDRRMTGRMSKWQFGALVKMCGLTLTPQELDKLWATLNVATDGMYSYSTLIQYFIGYKLPREERPPAYIYENQFNVDEEDEIWYDSREDTKDLVETARRIQRERKEEQLQRDHMARQAAINAATTTPREEQKPQPYIPPPTRSSTVYSIPLSRASTIPSTPGSRASFSSVQSVRTKSLLVKIRTDVVNNWEGLKSVFKYIDRNGCASITIPEMKDIMNSMQFGLDEEEKEELCKRFDAQKNGRFNYLQFMKCYAQRSDKQAHSKPFAYSKFTHKLETQQMFGGTSGPRTVNAVIEHFRDKLLKEHRTLRRAFKKLDRGYKGYLSVKDFKAALQMCNISLSSDDFYHILTEFDHNMDGRISYDNFLSTMLST